MQARISARVAGLRPIVLAEVYPVPITNFTRPGAISSTVWIAPASTDACRVKGFVTAGKSDIRDVCPAAWPRTTKVSREIIWLSRIPAPSKPAASMLRRSAISSGIGAVPGTRRWTRTGSVMAVTSLFNSTILRPRP